MKFSTHVAAALAASLILASSNAFSQTATGSMGVSMTVAAECTISASALDFGSVGIIDGNIDASANITVQCTEGSAYEIGLDAGEGAAATVATRKMTHGTDITKTANYSLYQDSGRTTVWGDGALETVDSATATGGDEVHPVYGRVFSGQNVPTGTYGDTITATITYGSSL